MKKVRIMEDQALETERYLQCDDGEYCKYEELGCDKICEGLAMISGKWKLKLLYLIGYYESIRYGELKKKAAPITHKMLAGQLKELEADGLITRTEYPEIPPHVEYALSQKGIDLIPMFDALFEWINKYK